MRGLASGGRDRRRLIPWLAIILLCSPLCWVAIPPLVDVPGHTAGAAIEAARPGNSLLHYYRWDWTLTLNMGGEVLMKLLGGGLAAGWWATLIVTTLLLAGGLATIETLNPKRASAAPWAAMYLFAFPWIWGFLNFLMAAGIAMIAFAATQRLVRRPALRAVLLVTSQIVALLCHAIGGLLLPLLVATVAVGEVIDRRRCAAGGGRWDWTASIIEIGRKCWPLVATVIMIAWWKSAAVPAADRGLSWDWPPKVTFFSQVLRDQDKVLDIACEAASCAVLVFGAVLGARWRWRQALPFLALLLLYFVMPARIDGSEAVDTRLLPLALFLGLGLQDWSGARPATAKWIAVAGATLLAIRTIAMTLGFLSYAADFKGQLRALDHVAPGSRMFVFVQHSCSKARWRMSRLDTLPALASLERQVWINAQWTVPGLDMLHSRYDPAGSARPLPSSMVWDPRCAVPDRALFPALFPLAPLDGIDYLWLVDTGPPPVVVPRLKLLWHWQPSYLYRVDRH